MYLALARRPVRRSVNVTYVETPFSRFTPKKKAHGSYAERAQRNGANGDQKVVSYQDSQASSNAEQQAEHRIHRVDF